MDGYIFRKNDLNKLRLSAQERELIHEDISEEDEYIMLLNLIYYDINKNKMILDYIMDNNCNIVSIDFMSGTKRIELPVIEETETCFMCSIEEFEELSFGGYVISFIDDRFEIKAKDE